jgi:cytidine deaminase
MTCAEHQETKHIAPNGGVWLAVVAEKMARITPCGGCRQRLAEFASADTKLHLCDDAGIVETVTMGEMLPLGFSGETLK